jgi:hypothetical protein
MRKDKEPTIGEFFNTPAEQKQRAILRIYNMLLFCCDKYKEIIPAKTKNTPPNVRIPDIEIPFAESEGIKGRYTIRYQMKIVNVRPDIVAWEEQPAVYQVLCKEEPGKKFRKLFTVKNNGRTRSVRGPNGKEISKLDRLEKIEGLVDKITERASMVFSTRLDSKQS